MTFNMSWTSDAAQESGALNSPTNTPPLASSEQIYRPFNLLKSLRIVNS